MVPGAVVIQSLSKHKYMLIRTHHPLWDCHVGCIGVEFELNPSTGIYSVEGFVLKKVHRLRVFIGTMILFLVLRSLFHHKFVRLFRKAILLI